MIAHNKVVFNSKRYKPMLKLQRQGRTINLLDEDKDEVFSDTSIIYGSDDDSKQPSQKNQVAPVSFSDKTQLDVSATECT